MKRGNLILTAMMVVMTMASWLATGEEPESPRLLPEMELGKLKLNISGFTQATFYDQLGEDGVSDSDIPTVRLKAILELEKWNLLSEVNFAEMDEEDGNWLRKLSVGYKLTDDWEITAGRIFVAAGIGGVPAPYALETVKYPRAFNFSQYGWGIGLDGKFANNWSLCTSLTGNTHTSFDSPEAFEDWEFSARLEKSFADKWTLAGTTQVSEDFFRFALDSTVKVNDKFYLRGAAYYGKNGDKVSDHFGAYAIAVYRPAKWFEFHSQLDYQRNLAKTYTEWEYSWEEKSLSVPLRDGSTFPLTVSCLTAEEVEYQTSDAYQAIWTNGIRLFAGPGDRFSVTADVELPIDGQTPNQDATVWCRGQIRF